MEKAPFIPAALGIIFIVVVSYSLRTLFFRKENLPPANNQKIRVVASFYPMYFFTKEIGGDKVNVTNLTPAGVEPHNYEPTTLDLTRVSNSQMLVLNGGMFEAWGDQIKEQIAASNVLIITAGAGMVNKDPHIWLDPFLAKKAVANIEQGFKKIDPKGAAYYRVNTKKLEDKLDQLDTDYKNGLINCPKKDFITSHAAFGYLAARYGINQVSINGLSPNEEPSLKKLAEIADLVKKENIKVIFFESLASPKLSETIASETGVKTLVLDPLEGISESDMRENKNYFSIMRQNLTNLEIALQCTR